VDIVSYTTGIFRLLEAKGRGAAIGSGNSIPDYVDPGRYCLMLETVRNLRQHPAGDRISSKILTK
jgi:hypothetical protein